MSEVKQHLTYQEQIEKLRSRGCIINNDTLCEEILENTGQHRTIAQRKFVLEAHLMNAYSTPKMTAKAH